MPKQPKPSDDDKRGGKRASRRGGKPGKTRGTAIGRNLETGKSFLLDEEDDGRGNKTFRTIGRNNPN
jgi:hypothetical protein